MTEIKIDPTLEKLIKFVLSKHKWMCYSSIQDFGLDAIRHRVEVLASVPSQ